MCISGLDLGFGVRGHVWLGLGFLCVLVSVVDVDIGNDLGSKVFSVRVSSDTKRRGRVQ